MIRLAQRIIIRALRTNLKILPKKDFFFFSFFRGFFSRFRAFLAAFRSAWAAFLVPSSMNCCCSLAVSSVFFPFSSLTVSFFAAVFFSLTGAATVFVAFFREVFLVFTDFSSDVFGSLNSLTVSSLAVDFRSLKTACVSAGFFSAFLPGS